MESKVGVRVNNAMSKGRIEERRGKAEMGVVKMPKGLNDWNGGEVQKRNACEDETNPEPKPHNPTRINCRFAGIKIAAHTFKCLVNLSLNT